ncbi:tetratricopeptide repeat-containing sulfotransferase family protein [uncultured Umboniibacter sp.]|uniref:tetratricopeptide repeat-containing sulfotransferase family protein n=1 Tax=uncultured Umboniibacter sp. TaxID=1798917 RepID=UPI0026317D0F|nr:tetratricopeptide repeat-containing sulfotransferase family protein [uncultured Umboniibacter sp.]
MSLIAAQNYLNQGNLQAAHRETMRIIQGNPHDLEALRVLLAIALKSRNSLKIAQILNQINRLDPSQASLFDEALAWHQIQLPQWAITALKQLNPERITRAKLSSSAANLATQYDQHSLGLALTKRTVVLTPNNANAHFELGRSLVFSGDFEAGQQSLIASLNIQPAHPLALQLLATLPKAYWPQDLLQQIDNAIAEASQLGDLKRLHEGRYRVLEDKGAYTQAFSAIETANNLHREQLGSRLTDPSEKLSSILTTFDQLTVTTHTSPSEATPIFIVGLPRSGTTLLEQILSGQDEIQALGELPQLPGIVERAIQHAKANEYVVNSSLVAKHYLEQTAPLRTNSHYFVDKMPLNYQLIGFIARALPSAKIIHIRRDPMDVCFAQYRQIFADSAHAMDYSYSLEHLASYHQSFSQLMNQWEQRFPNRIFDIAYEQLVTAPKTSLASLSQYLGIELAAECLDLRLNERAVSTASAGQIREPIGGQHLGRWRHYEAAMMPHLAKLLRD